MKYILIVLFFLCVSLVAETNYTLKDVNIKKGIATDKKTNKPITGILKKYSDSGKLKAETPYKNGKKEGIDKMYLSDRIVWEIPYKDGKREGIHKSYFDGQLSAETPYKNGKKEGIDKMYILGELVSETPYKDGKEEGIMKAYYGSGKLKLEVLIKNGKAIKGTLYNTDGSSEKMTNAHFHNLGLDY